MKLSNESLAIALSQEGVCEEPKGSNCGPKVNQYLKSVGLGPGQAWCMAFVYFCVSQAAKNLGVKNPLIKTASVMNQWYGTDQRKLITRISEVKPGDIFIMEFDHGKGHTGFVVKIEKGIVYTIEGNTNGDGSREGYEVACRQRKVSTIKGFIQFK